MNHFFDAYLTLRGIIASRSKSNLEFASSNQINNFKLKKLKALFITSFHQVDYYRKLFIDYDFDPEKFSDLEDLSRLPILNKSEVIASPSKFINPSKTFGSIKLKTSGTTGQPLVAFTTRKQWINEQASIWRHWRWAGYSLRDKMVIFRSYNPNEGESFTKLDRLRNWLYVSPYHLTDSFLETFLNQIVKWKPRFFRGYPSSIYLVALAAKRFGVSFDGLKGVLTASEVLTEQYRAVIEDGLGCKVFDHYGQAEITTMAQECEEHQGMHFLDDYAHTEFLPTERNGEYRVIATNLHNHAMPLIRYDTGDLVNLSESSCKCGRSFKIASKIIGRNDQFLIGIEGNFIPSINIYTFFAGLSEVKRFQVIQYGLAKVEILIETIEENEVEISLLSSIIKKQFDAILGNVKLKFNGPFNISGDGKIVTIIQRSNLYET